MDLPTIEQAIIITACADPDKPAPIL